MAKKSIASILVGSAGPAASVTMPTTALAVTGQLTPDQTQALVAQRNSALAQQQYQERLISGAEVQARRTLRALLSTQQAALSVANAAMHEASTNLDRAVQTEASTALNTPSAVALLDHLRVFGFRSLKVEFVETPLAIWPDDDDYAHSNISPTGVIRIELSIMHDSGERRSYGSSRKDNLTPLISLPPFFIPISELIERLHDQLTVAIDARNKAQAAVSLTEAKLADIPARLAEAKDDLALRSLQENDPDAAAALSGLASMLTGEIAAIPDLVDQPATNQST